MPAPCYYHPDKTAVGNCVQCGIPICNDCTDRIGEKTVCHKCVSAVRTRLEQQMANAPAGAYTGSSSAQSSQSGVYGGPQDYAVQAPMGGVYATPLATVAPAQWLVGIGLALVIGIVGAIAVEKFEINLHLGLSLLYVLLGYGVGWGLLKGTGHGGVPVAAAAVVIFLLSVGVGLLVEAGDVLNAVRASDPTLTVLSAADVLPMVVRHQNFMHWVLVAFGVYGCFKYVMRRG